MKIKPASNNQLKLWRKLLKTKYRKNEGLFIAEGERCVEQIVQSGSIEVETVVVENGYTPGRDISESELPMAAADQDDFHSISDTETPQGILAICKIPEEASINSLQSKTGLIVAMDAVQDPGNVGTMIRTASWFNTSGILFGDGSADPFHPKVVRSTAGATGTLPYMKGNLHELFNQFEQNGWEIFLMDGAEDADEIHDVKPSDKTILVIGNEGNGITDTLFSPGRRKVRIPGNSHTVESLNAAIALGIGLYTFMS
ncbi:RNA methyltransferase [Rhodohalobacter sp. SW132]|uniref:TrmH family RNA methyltransferase n=1 Tax=Rhodohalobacter sp. SW132 TaxID=2293433 RepID=UPI000E27F1B2|nr:RNA methyltransferase [Rhodohalobacter sp. SW132]REL24839.1 RNA methyltransferase [Rhodohalobacter sp. SW132]